jgi:hypothetical protein
MLSQSTVLTGCPRPLCDVWYILYHVLFVAVTLCNCYGQEDTYIPLYTFIRSFLIGKHDMLCFCISFLRYSEVGISVCAAVCFETNQETTKRLFHSFMQQVWTLNLMGGLILLLTKFLSIVEYTFMKV